MDEENKSGYSDQDWEKWIKSRKPTHDDYAWENRMEPTTWGQQEEELIQVGDLVRQKEGPRMGGLVIKVFRKEFDRIQVLWPNGERWTYKSVFLKKM